MLTIRFHIQSAKPTIYRYVKERTMTHLVHVSFFANLFYLGLLLMAKEAIRPNTIDHNATSRIKLSQANQTETLSELLVPCCPYHAIGRPYLRSLIPVNLLTSLM